MNVQKFNPPTNIRGWIYLIATATFAVLIVLGVVTDADAVDVLAQLGVLLGMGTTGLAAANTSRHKTD